MKKQDLVNEMKKYILDIQNNKTVTGHLAETLVNMFTARVNENQSFKVSADKRIEITFEE